MMFRFFPGVWGTRAAGLGGPLVPLAWQRRDAAASWLSTATETMTTPCWKPPTCLRVGALLWRPGAFIAEHSVAPTVGTDRPDVEDVRVLTDFAKRGRQNRGGQSRARIRPKARSCKARGPAADVRPKTTDSCTQS